MPRLPNVKKKRLFRRCGTHGKFRSLMSWLRKNGYIIKDGPGSRAHYRYNPERVGFTLKERYASRFERTGHYHRHNNWKKV